MGRRGIAAGLACAGAIAAGTPGTANMEMRADATPARALNTVEPPRLNFYCPKDEINPVTGQRDHATLAGSIAIRQVPRGSHVAGEWRLSAGDSPAHLVELDGDARIVAPGEEIISGSYKTNTRGSDPLEPNVHAVFTEQFKSIDSRGAVLRIISGRTSPAVESVTLPLGITADLKCSPAPPPPPPPPPPPSGGNEKKCPVEMTNTQAENAFSKPVVKEGELIRLFYSAANPYDTPLKAPRAVLSIPSGFTIAVKNHRLKRINPNTDQWVVKVNQNQLWRKNKNIYGSVLLRASQVNRDRVRSSRFTVVARNPFGTKAICEDAKANSSAAVLVINTTIDDKPPGRVTG